MNLRLPVMSVRAWGKSDGFSLTEVMAASFIGLLLILSLVATVTQQRATMRAQQLVGEMHQNLRFAMDSVSRDIRTAGYGLEIDPPLLDDWVTWISGFTENPMVIEGLGGAPDQLVIVGALDNPVTTLSAPAPAGTNVIVVADASAFNTFDKSIIFIGRTSTARILGINGNALTISLHPTHNNGLRFDFPAGSPVELVKEYRYRWYNAADYPYYPFLSRQDSGADYSRQWMKVTAGYIEDFQVARNGDLLEVAITAIVAHPDRHYHHPEKDDPFRRATLASTIKPRN